ncbi:MAG TPA: glycine cleavage system protein GcvH [Acidobacteriota bacterium]|nr:glycine cleavage system protein GcvH [Acidobacteriota bacterium]
MNVPEDLLYTKDHEWVLVEGSSATIGITDHAQDALGDVVFVELPSPEESFGARDVFGSVESVKAVSEVYMPVSGVVAAVNEALEDTPELVNSDPYGEGWMIQIRIEDGAELDDLVSPEDYQQFLEEEGE